MWVLYLFLGQTSALALDLLLPGVAVSSALRRARAPQPVPTGYETANLGWRVVGPQVVEVPDSATRDDCATTCLGKGTGCIAFNWVRNSSSLGFVCEHSGWGAAYAVNRTDQASVYYTKGLPRNDTSVQPKIRYELAVPTRGIVLTGGPFAAAFATNVAYLAQFPVDDMLYWFRKRAGVPNPAGATSWGWDGHPGSALMSGHDHSHSGHDHSGHDHSGHHLHSHSHSKPAQVDHCNPGGDPTTTINGEWKAPDPHATAVFTISPPANGSFSAYGPSWAVSPTGQVFPNGSFWLDFPQAGRRSTRAAGEFVNSSSWKQICWWTGIRWIVPPPGGTVTPGAHWCKIGSPGCKKPPGPPAPPPGPAPGTNVDGPYGLRGSVAGAFMMGSGGATRWADLPELRARLEAVVGNISGLQGKDGFAMGFLRNETNNHEGDFSPRLLLPSSSPHPAHLSSPPLLPLHPPSTLLSITKTQTTSSRR
jgi:hypothetical protein